MDWNCFAVSFWVLFSPLLLPLWWLTGLITLLHLKCVFLDPFWIWQVWLYLSPHAGRHQHLELLSQSPPVSVVRFVRWAETTTMTTTRSVAQALEPGWWEWLDWEKRVRVPLSSTQRVSPALANKSHQHNLPSVWLNCIWYNYRDFKTISTSKKGLSWDCLRTVPISLLSLLSFLSPPAGSLKLLRTVTLDQLHVPHNLFFPFLLTCTEEEKKKKAIRLPVQRSVETGLAVEFKSRFTRQPSRDPDAEDPKPGAWA